jgi:transcriptional regulator with PAS, ATPase and Fis domain
MRFEAELNDLVADFAARLADLAQDAAYAMVANAFDSSAPDHGPRAPSLATKRTPRRGSLSERLMDVERDIIIEALEDFGGNVTRTATALRVSRQSLQRKIRRLKI